MPQYEFKNVNTGEVQEVSLSLSQFDEWKAANPEWERYYSSNSAPKLVSGAKSALTMAGSNWNEHLTNIKKASGKDNTIKT